MQDGKALQAGTSHYLGTKFRPRGRHPVSGLREGAQQYCQHHQLGRVDAADRRG